MQNTPKEIEQANSELWQFFLLAFLFSWLMWLPGILISHHIISADATVLITPTIATVLKWLGGLGPSVAAMYLVLRQQGKTGIRNLFRRVRDWRLGVWYFPAMLLLPLLVLAAHCLNKLMYGVPFPQTGLLSEPWWIPVVFIIFLVMQFSEELGWRAYALDRLQQRWNSLFSSILLGCIWAVWHLPMFLTNGFGQHDYHLPFGQFLLTLVFTSILITWLQNNTKNSLAPAFILHAYINLSGEVLPLIEKNKEAQGNYTAWILVNSLLFVTVMIVILFWGYKNFTRSQLTKQAA